MSRSLGVAAKNFIDTYLTPTNPEYKHIYNYVVPSHTFIITKYPYEHKRQGSRAYTYNVKDGFDMCMISTPWEKDLMGNPKMSADIKCILKNLVVLPDCENLNPYKQIVVHNKTYTGVFNMECGTEDKVIELTLME